MSLRKRKQRQQRQQQQEDEQDTSFSKKKNTKVNKKQVLEQSDEHKRVKTRNRRSSKSSVQFRYFTRKSKSNAELPYQFASLHSQS